MAEDLAVIVPIDGGLEGQHSITHLDLVCLSQDRVVGLKTTAKFRDI